MALDRIPLDIGRDLARTSHLGGWRSGDRLLADRRCHTTNRSERRRDFRGMSDRIFRFGRTRRIELVACSFGQASIQPSSYDALDLGPAPWPPSHFVLHGQPCIDEWV